MGQRIGNLKFRQTSYLSEPPEHIGYEICKFEPNNYYGRESEFIKDGEYYRPDDKHYDFVKIHKSCFESPEISYTIASWKWNKHDNCYDLSFCGDRPLYLNNEEWKIFKHLLTYGFHKLNPNFYE